MFLYLVYIHIHNTLSICIYIYIYIYIVFLYCTEFIVIMLFVGAGLRAPKSLGARLWGML